MKVIQQLTGSSRDHKLLEPVARNKVQLVPQNWFSEEPGQLPLHEKPKQTQRRLLPPPPEFHSVPRHGSFRSFDKLTIPALEGGRERGNGKNREKEREKGRESENTERKKDEEIKVEEMGMEIEIWTEKDGYPKL